MAMGMSNTWRMCSSSLPPPGMIGVLKAVSLLLLLFCNIADSRSISLKPTLAIIREYGKQTGNLQPIGSTAMSKMERRNRRTYGNTRKFAMIPSRISANSNKDIEDDAGFDVDFEVAKKQIYSEVREVESIFKGVIARVINHLMQYMKQKIAQSCLQFYIVNPLGLGIGNLLNGNMNDQYITNKLGIPYNATPETFNMPYQQVNVPSHFGSKVTKRCWLIRSDKKDTNKAFVLMHGWFGNMQSCLPFVDTLKKIGVTETHHILILDLHDDIGKSFNSNIGLKGVTDLYDAAAYLYNELGIKDLSIYAQSVSGLSALMFDGTCRKSFVKVDGTTAEGSRCPVAREMDDSIIGMINIERIIIESPVANIHQHIFNSPSESLKWMTEQFLSTLDSNGSHLESLSLQTLLKDPETCSKVYLLQGAKDMVTTPEMLHHEMTRNDQPIGVKTFLFKDGGHANLSATIGDEYQDTLKYVILGRSIWEFIRGKGTQALIGSPDELIR